MSHVCSCDVWDPYAAYIPSLTPPPAVATDVIGETNLRFLQLLVFSIVALHWAACLFYFSSSWTGFGPATWVYEADLVPNEYNGYYDAQNAEKYLYSFYW